MASPNAEAPVPWPLEASAWGPQALGEALAPEVVGLPWGAGAPQAPKALGEDLQPLWVWDGWCPSTSCEVLVQALEGLGFAPTGGAYPPGYRNNDRLVFEAPALAGAWWAKLAPQLPHRWWIDGAWWRPVGLNPRFRACRYAGGQAFAPHRDGAHQPSLGLRSWLTFQLYLDEDFEGGATPFWAGPGGPELLRVAPRSGRAILFDHRAWHAGEPVPSGVKHVLRTDLMFEAEGPGPTQGAATPRAGAEPAEVGHRGYLWAMASQGGSLCTAGRDGRLLRWRHQGSAWRLEGDWAVGSGSILALASGPEGLALGCRSGHLWRLGAAGPEAWGHLGAAILSLTWTREGRCWAALADGSLQAWEAASVGPHTRVAAHAGWAWALAARPQGGVWSGGADGWLRAWGAGGEAEGAWHLGVPILALAASAEGGLLVGDEAGRLHHLRLDLSLDLVWQGEGPLLAVGAGQSGAWACGGEAGLLTWGQGRQLLGQAQGKDFVRAVHPWAGGWAWGGYEGLLRWEAVA